MSPLVCPQCATAFHAHDINEPLGIATCHACKAVLDLRTRGPSELATRVRPVGPTPENFVVTDEPGEFTVQWRWFTPVAILLTFFCLGWDGFMIGWFTMAFSSGLWPMALFGTLHGAVGVGLTYFTLCSYVNRTRITVARGTLSITHGPLPWRGPGTLDASSIAQLYCVEQVSRGRNTNTVTYELHALFTDGRRRKLLGTLATKERAFWLERVLESRLAITDAPVEGELRA